MNKLEEKGIQERGGMEKVQKVTMKKMKEMISLTSLMGYMLIYGYIYIND